MSQHVLIVEDEVKIASLLQDYLIQSGFEVQVLHDGSDVENWLAENNTSIILLDLMLRAKLVWKFARKSGKNLICRSS